MVREASLDAALVEGTGIAGCIFQMFLIADGEVMSA
jgi:hypothetical protein